MNRLALILMIRSLSLHWDQANRSGASGVRRNGHRDTQGFESRHINIVKVRIRLDVLPGKQF